MVLLYAWLLSNLANLAYLNNLANFNIAISSSLSLIFSFLRDKNTPIFMIESRGSGKDKSFSISAIGEPSTTSYITSVPADKFWKYLEQFNKPGKTLNGIISDIKNSGVKWATETAQLMREVGNLPLREAIKLWIKLSFTMVWGGYMSEISKSAASYVEQLPTETKKQILITLATGQFWSILTKIVRPK